MADESLRVVWERLDQYRQAISDLEKNDIRHDTRIADMNTNMNAKIDGLAAQVATFMSESKVSSDETARKLDTVIANQNQKAGAFRASAYIIGLILAVVPIVVALIALLSKP
ncbi:hypothetical protein NCG89_00735 [Spongiibacter taiwanensis]|uniref:hypothetical protein n=1 Tax=Spongiibacter taiwanensis TaxID=1748242 RepID=UPI0020351D74|nr:hypothetical protein [Spongiibacter taiwanensis]USA43328.1 hypothetical protein NCG89_00735 [Spongiibacter taiwanensis]